ncbi:nitroreductase family protein [Stenotrophomonas acidaminiphila]|uniref:nitroreductase family protein n=1 Tax=Stenotrophomonas acidaminiphila TaxID=128780 RepID=UPI0020C609D4|nr:nitroreductase [Stenotrophomonas acidaminiphila]
MSDSCFLQALDQRRSVPSLQLAEPGPDDATVLAMLAAAVRVPDHGKLVPFRVLRLRGDARHALGDYLARRSRERTPDASLAAVEKDRQRFSHAPLVLTVVARLQDNPKVPEQEQLLTAGCVCFALLQAAQGFGFGAQWLTAWMAYDEGVARHLGVAANERIVGFIHVGTPRMRAPERARPDPASLLQDWQP